MMSQIVLFILLSMLPVYSAANCNIANCAQCNGNSVSGCDSCNDGFWLRSGACQQCPSHCSLCTHSSQCQSCVTAYWAPGQLCNSACSANCTDSGCEDTTGYCNGCKPGKYGVTCEHDCSLCINGNCDLKKCTNGCKDGYEQYNTDLGYAFCYPCSSNCIKCYNATYCIQCEQGFYRDYYRNQISGRGTMNCKQCWTQCTQCTFADKCPESCNSECIRQGCEVTGTCSTTNSRTATKPWTTEIVHEQPDTTTKIFPQIPDTSATDTSLCPNECKDNCDTHGECHTTTAKNSKLEDVYYEAFGHGIATGIGILIVVGTLAGVVIFFTLRTKCLRTICPIKTTTCSRENHVYVNTQEEAGTMPTSINRSLRNEVNTNSVTLSEEDVDTNREYVSLGERQPENHYSDLQTNRQQTDDQ